MPLQADTELYVEQSATGACFLSSCGVFLTCSMSAQDIWATKYHELWEKLEKTQRTACVLVVTALIRCIRHKALRSVQHHINNKLV